MKLDITDNIYLDIGPFKKKWKLSIYKDGERYAGSDIIDPDEPWTSFRGRNKQVRNNLLYLLDILADKQLPIEIRHKIQTWFAELQKNPPIYEEIQDLNIIILPRYGFTEIEDNYYLTETSWVWIYNERNEPEKMPITYVKTKDKIHAQKPNDKTLYFKDTLLLDKDYWMLNAKTFVEAKNILDHEDHVFDRNGQKVIVKNSLLETIDKHVWHNTKANILLQLTWTIASYFYDVFDFFPILDVKGPSDSGKSLLCSTLAATIYHGKIYVDPTEAIIFRLKQAGRMGMIFDENDMLNSKDKDAKYRVKQILRASVAKYGGEVSRTETIKDRRIVVNYNCYSPTVSSGIEGLEGVLESRSIPFTMTRATGGREYMPANPYNYNDLRNKLYVMRFVLLDEVIRERNYLAKHGIHEDITGRQFDIWSPLFTIGRMFLDDDEYQELLKFALIVANSYKNSPRNINDTETLLLGIKEIFVDENYYSVSKITDAINHKEGWTGSDRWGIKKTGKILTRLGFINKKRKIINNRKERIYYIEKKLLAEKLRAYLGESL